MAETRYETARELGERIGHTDSVVCADCGVFVMDKAAHTRSHSIMSAQAWALGVLKTHHIAAEIHDRYDMVERIDSKKFDSWSGDALAEVIDGPAVTTDYPQPEHRHHFTMVTGAMACVCGERIP